MTLFELKKKVVIVTGGAGHLGKEISRAFADVGAFVYVAGRDHNKLEVLREYNKNFSEEQIFTQILDVTQEKNFKEWVEGIFQKHQHVDCLVNNANSANREEWEDLDKEKFKQGFEGTLNQYFTCSQIVSKYMLQQKSGCLINNASLFSFLAPNFPMHLDLNNAAAAHHAAAKGGILQMTRYLAALWAPHSIRVNAVSPGYFPQKRGPDRPDYMREITLRIPMKRIGQPHEVAGTFVFLASEAASYITGQNIVIDGGYSIW